MAIDGTLDASSVGSPLMWTYPLYRGPQLFILSKGLDTHQGQKKKGMGLLEEGGVGEGGEKVAAQIKI